MKRLFWTLLFVTGVWQQAQAQEEGGAPAEAAGPTTAERVEEVSGRLDALEEQYAETKGTVLGLAKLKMSGYVQARYQTLEKPATGGQEGFSIRRGRLKATYMPTFGGFVLQIDATPRGVTLKDAEVHFQEPWTTQKITLVMGQTKWPFGYEVVQSSSEREFPERTRVVRAFAPGERDRGAKLLWKNAWARAVVGVFDGNGTEANTFSDNDTEKDIVGRLGVDFDIVALGVSGWFGKTFSPNDSMYVRRTRYGADAQVYLDLLAFGATALKGEAIMGETYGAPGAEKFGLKGFGWYALLLQNIGLHDQIGVRYDYWDPDTEKEEAADAASPDKPASSNSVGTLGFLVAHHFDEVFKLSVVYELPMTGLAGDAADPRDNVFTVQAQAKF